jgi:hypothetical protein
MLSLDQMLWHHLYLNPSAFWNVLEPLHFLEKQPARKALSLKEFSGVVFLTLSVTYELAQQDRVFVTGKPF